MDLITLKKDQLTLFLNLKIQFICTPIMLEKHRGNWMHFEGNEDSYWGET